MYVFLTVIFFWHVIITVIFFFSGCSWIYVYLCKKVWLGCNKPRCLSWILCCLECFTPLCSATAGYHWTIVKCVFPMVFDLNVQTFSVLLPLNLLTAIFPCLQGTIVSWKTRVRSVMTFVWISGSDLSRNRVPGLLFVRTRIFPAQRVCKFCFSISIILHYCNVELFHIWFSCNFLYSLVCSFNLK